MTLFFPNRVEDFHSTLTKFREDTKAAQKHNELALNALYDGQDLRHLVAFKLEHDREMKRKNSVAKLRWIRAITKVINRCFIEKVFSFHNSSHMSMYD